MCIYIYIYFLLWLQFGYLVRPISSPQTWLALLFHLCGELVQWGGTTIYHDDNQFAQCYDSCCSWFLGIIDCKEGKIEMPSTAWTVRKKFLKSKNCLRRNLLVASYQATKLWVCALSSSSSLYSDDFQCMFCSTSTSDKQMAISLKIRHWSKLELDLHTSLSISLKT